MDLLSLYAALCARPFRFRDVPPFWDRDLRELYEARLSQAETARRSGRAPATRLRRQS